MNELNLFLKALEELKEYKLFIPKLTTTPMSKPAYKSVNIQIWIVDKSDKNKEKIVEVESTYRVVTDTEKDKAIQEVSKNAIKEVLKYYGI